MFIQLAKLIKVESCQTLYLNGNLQHYFQLYIIFNSEYHFQNVIIIANMGVVLI